MNSIWYKNAVFYSLDIETFYDSDGDGIGDFQGLIERLDYLAGLGITCIWLLPFYPSPNRDNGYDVTDYYNVDPRLGTLGDFAEFMDKANQSGIHIIIDLVVNHTSIQHPWFQEGRKNPDSKFHNYYVWVDEPLEYEKKHLMLTGEEETIWTYDEVAKKYYLHRFYKEQPDLNIGNREVRLEILKIMGFWLRMGVSGFRIDAAEMLIEPYGIKETEKADFSDFLEEMRTFISSKESNAILIAETNVEPDKMNTYLKSGKRMHVVFNFYLNQYLFLSLAKKSSVPLYQAIKNLPPLEEENQWLNFLRHHDELSLKLLHPVDQETVFKTFAPKADMKIFGRGIRRRLAPMLKQDRKKMELYFSLLFSLPGVPLIRYGDEIGMGENLALPGRSSVRTPMQWSEAQEAGFSEALNLICPVIAEGEFGYKTVNVRKQQRDQDSFLNWIERLIIIRKQFAEIGRGEIETIPTQQEELFVHSYVLKEKKVFFFHNLTDKPATIDLKTYGLDTLDLFELFSDAESKEIRGKVILVPFGYKWLKVKT